MGLQTKSSPNPDSRLADTIRLGFAESEDANQKKLVPEKIEPSEIYDDKSLSEAIRV